MELTAYRDGIFSNSDPNAAPGLTSYSDGSLGSAPDAFRDGLFSQSDPMARPGSLLTSYSDGSLGATIKPFYSPNKPVCIQQCMVARTRTARRRCISKCIEARGGMALRRTKRATSGLGFDLSTMSTNMKVGIGVGAALLVGVLVMSAKKGKRR